MDAFYAAVEMREDSSLKDKALIVGGDPESRSVVCTANYLARKKKGTLQCPQLMPKSLS